MTNEFDPRSNEYHFTREEGLPRDDYRGYYTPAAPVESAKPPKRRVWRVAALVLAAVLLAGACGYGGAALYRSAAFGAKTATVQQSSREAVQVSVKRVDGQTQMTPSEVYAATVNSVVSINCSATSMNIFGQRVETPSSGSGFIITADGYIVTNYHVISGASSISVTLYNGETYTASLVGGDSDYDTAVLKIDAAGLSAVTLGSSADMNVGDTVLAIGNPLGELTFSMSQGIISCLDRAINVDGTPFNMIQVDCSINPGNSGGPLVNLYGEVVGIVSAKYSSYSSTTVEGLGFAIPMDDVQTVIADIMENGEVSDKAYLAINAGTLTESMAAQYGIDITKGVFVFSSIAGGAGEKAGLKLGDVITKVDDTEITSMEDLSRAKKGYKAGDTATLTVYREKQYLTLSITFDAQPQVTGSAEETPDNGGNSGDSRQVPDSWEDFYNYFFGNRGW